MKNYIIVLIILSVFTSCTKKTTDIKETIETEIINEDKLLVVYSDEITALLYENEK